MEVQKKLYLDIIFLGKNITIHQMKFTKNGNIIVHVPGKIYMFYFCLLLSTLHSKKPGLFIMHSWIGSFCSKIADPIKIHKFEASIRIADLSDPIPTPLTGMPHIPSCCPIAHGQHTCGSSGMHVYHTELIAHIGLYLFLLP